jgi:hypothetical protein
MESSVDEPARLVGIVAITLFLGASSLLWFKGGVRGHVGGHAAVVVAAALTRKAGSSRRPPDDDDDDRGGTRSTTKSGDHRHPAKLRSVFSVKQRPVKVTGGVDGSSSSSSSRPFESSYYFAHNGQSTG